MSIIEHDPSGTSGRREKEKTTNWMKIAHGLRIITNEERLNTRVE
jgi:hypothetical protein